MDCQSSCKQQFPTATNTTQPANKMKNELPSLITPDTQAGLTLAGQLADRLQAQIEQANAQVEHPGGTNYRLPATIPKEIIAGILFYAIAAANQGWTK
jgi:hypothetical protein